MTIKHKSAAASHYDHEAKHYDIFNEEASRTINRSITKILKKHNVKSVVDLSCGTGSQVFWLNKRGFDVVGLDINNYMLKIAKEKARELKLDLQFHKGDMRTAALGKFDAAISIFNAVGHLTKEDFLQAMMNARNNLVDGGLLIFDIFNFDFVREKDNITTFTIDWYKHTDEKRARVIQYSTIDEHGIFASFTTAIEDHENDGVKTKTSAQTLQIYSAAQLKDMLTEAGFAIENQTAIDGDKFKRRKTDRILTVAKKI